MGLLADLYLAQEVDADTYPKHPTDFPERVQMQSITALEFSTLWAFMKDERWQAIESTM